MKVTANKRMTNNLYIKKRKKKEERKKKKKREKTLNFITVMAFYINYCNELFPKMVRKKNCVVLYRIYIS